MPRNKARLQLALYARPHHPGSYHYALFVSPRNGRGPLTKHHVKSTLQVDNILAVAKRWRYEQIVFPDIEAEQGLLVRIIIAKLAASPDAVDQILARVPVYQVDDLDTDRAKSFSCQMWVSDALQELKRHAVVTTPVGEWKDVKRKALEYVDSKRGQRRWNKIWKARPGFR